MPSNTPRPVLTHIFFRRLPVLVVAATLAITAGSAYWHLRNDREVRDQLYRYHGAQLSGTAARLADLLDNVFDRLLLIAMDPSVASFTDADLNHVERAFAHEWESGRLTEIYIVERDFDGSKAPFRTFEFEEKDVDHGQGESLHSLERESREYQVIKEQLERFVADSDVQALISDECELCVVDESGMPGSGFIYSVAIRRDGELRGLVAGMIPTARLRSILPAGAAGSSDTLAGMFLVTEGNTLLVGPNVDDEVHFRVISLLAGEGWEGSLAKRFEDLSLYGSDVLGRSLEFSGGARWSLLAVIWEPAGLGALWTRWSDTAGIFLLGTALAGLCFVASRRMAEQQAHLEAIERSEETLRERQEELSARVEELNCLYDIARLVERGDSSLESSLQAVVDRIPAAWPCPESTRAILAIGDLEIRSPGSSLDVPLSKVVLRAHGREVGDLAILVDGDTGESCEFSEGQRLLSAVSEQVSILVERHQETAREKELEERLRQSQKMEALGTLAGGIAHDFNNILTGIIGYVDLARRDAERDSRSHDNLGHVLGAARRASELVKQILTFTRETGEEKHAMVLQPVLGEALQLVRSSIPPNIDIIEAVDPDCGPVFADATQFHQVVMNLCTNAYHAMRLDGGTLRVTLAGQKVSNGLRLEELDLPPGDYAVLRIEDSGHGIDPATRKRIFDPYFTTKEPNEGTGLGLATVHGIVEGSGGGIQVESEPGKGSAFTLYFPIYGTPSRQKAEREVNEMPRGRERVLVVDDEPALAEMIRSSLMRLGYSVVATADASRALDLFREPSEEFHLVITDLLMREMDGESLLRQIWELIPWMPAILATGTPGQVPKDWDSDDRVLILDKPIMPETLAQAVRKAIDHSKRRRSGVG